MNTHRYLLDTHGHVLCADADGTLFFRRPHPAMLDAAVCVRAHDAAFFRAGSSQPWFIASDHERIVLSAEPRHGDCMIVTREAVWQIICSGFALSADPDGTVSFRPARAAWESFHAIGGNVLTWLAAALTHGVGSRSLDRAIPPEAITLAGGVLSYEGFDFEIARQAHLDPDRSRTGLIYADACLEPVRAYNPVICYGVFGNIVLLDTLALAVRSITHFAAIAPHFLVLTDLPEHAVRSALAFLPPHRISVFAQSFITANDFLLARYRIADWPLIARYGPILYLDLDIVCTGPLAPLLDQIARSTVLCCNTEGDRGQGHHVWFGERLFQHDGRLSMVENRFVNSGAIGVDHISTARDIFADVLLVAREMAHRHRDDFAALDQPCFNYVLSKTATCDTTTLAAFVVNWPAHQFADIPRIGLVHFCGGVGGFASKHEQMAAYLRFIGLPDPG